MFMNSMFRECKIYYLFFHNNRFYSRKNFSQIHKNKFLFQALRVTYGFIFEMNFFFTVIKKHRSLNFSLKKNILFMERTIDYF